MIQMRVDCDYCGGSVSKPPRVVKKNKYNFCGPECEQRFYDKYDRTKAEKVELMKRYIAKNQPVTSREIAEYLELNIKMARGYLRELRHDKKVKMKQVDTHKYTYELTWGKNYGVC